MNNSSPWDSLSAREQQVVEHLLAGKSNKLIASALGISESTVEFHLKNIYARYNVSSRVELILKLRESTVASEEKIADNRDTRIGPKWVALLKETVSRIGKEFQMENNVEMNNSNGGTTLSFFDSIRICFQKYAEFQGRASRPEFWWFALFVTLAATAFAYVNENLASVFLIAVLLPFLAVSTRRLRDSGKNPWWTLFILVPVGGIVMLAFYWALPPASPIPEEAQTV